MADEPDKFYLRVRIEPAHRDLKEPSRPQPQIRKWAVSRVGDEERRSGVGQAVGDVLKLSGVVDRVPISNIPVTVTITGPHPDSQPVIKSAYTGADGVAILGKEAFAWPEGGTYRVVGTVQNSEGANVHVAYTVEVY